MRAVAIGVALAVAVASTSRTETMGVTGTDARWTPKTPRVLGGVW